jgi:hypothetical protein
METKQEEGENSTQGIALRAGAWMAGLKLTHQNKKKKKQEKLDMNCSVQPQTWMDSLA